MTKTAIKEGFEKLRPGEQLRQLEAAARSRSEADWLVGMNATRAATIRGRAWVGGVVSLGRVQTPTLALLVKREREIQAFVPEPYWLVARAVRPSLRGPLVRGRRDAPEGRQARRGDRGEGLRQGRRRRVGRAQGAVRARAAPLRPHLAAARREPPLRLLGAPHAAGRAVALRGQEGDHLPANELTLALRRPRPAAEADRRHAPADRRVRRGRALRARACSSCRSRASSTTRRSTDHHAIIPTDVEHDVSRFSPDERRIFDLVARRFLAVFHPPARYARTTVVTLVEEERFRTRGKITLEAGWRGVYGLLSEADAGRAEAGRGRRERERRAAAARAGPDGHVRRRPRSRPRRRSRRRATPRRRCSRRWRRRAS